MADTTDQRSGGAGGDAGRPGEGSGAPRDGAGGGVAIPPEFQARVREGVELLRPHPHRGDLIAAGAVPLTVALLLINLRLNSSWGDGVFFVLDALACGLVLGMGVLAPMEEERPRAYQVVLQLTGLALLFVTLLRLAQVFGVEEPLGSAWTALLILGLVTAAAVWLARERRSEVCTLLAGVTGTFALLAFVDLVFSPDGPATTRWVLLLAAILLLAGALVLRDRHRRDSVYLIDAAGVAILVLGITFVGELLLGALLSIGPDELFVRTGGLGVIWKLVLLAAGLGLVAYAGVDREAGPGYIGALILLIFVVLVGMPGEGGPSLWFWPLVLLLIGGAMIAAGLRPRRPLPPEPARGDPAPVVPAPVSPAAPPTGAAAQLPSAPASLAADPPMERRRAPWTGPDEPDGPSSADATARPPASRGPGRPPSPAGPAGRPPASTGPAKPPSPADPDPDSSDFVTMTPEPPADPPTRPQPPIVPPEELRRKEPRAHDERPTAPPPLEPEPPARGSLWARPDPGEQPTRAHERLPARDDEE